MTIYEKLLEARRLLTEMDLKKSGFNKYGNFKYFELADIVPAISFLSRELKFICLLSIYDDKCELKIKDLEKNEEISFFSCLAEADTKKTDSLQKLGATHTYLRRYMYLIAFDIIEPDIVDATINKYQNNQKDQNQNEYLKLKIALVEYIEAGYFEHPENVERVIKEKNLVQMRKALETAKEKENENNK